MEDFDFGFSSMSQDEISCDDISVYKARVEDLYQAIIPLLDNLQKNSNTNPYIHWPDRDQKIKQFKEKLYHIKNGTYK